MIDETGHCQCSAPTRPPARRGLGQGQLHPGPHAGADQERQGRDGGGGRAAEWRQRQHEGLLPEGDAGGRDARGPREGQLQAEVLLAAAVQPGGLTVEHALAAGVAAGQ